MHIRFMDSEETISDRLRVLKEARGLTNTDLAEAVGVTQPSVSRWLTGKAYPRQDQISLLSELFNVSVAHLVGQQKSQVNPVKLVTALTAAKTARDELTRVIESLEFAILGADSTEEPRREQRGKNPRKGHNLETEFGRGSRKRGNEKEPPAKADGIQ